MVIWQWKVIFWGVLGNFERAQFMAELWVFGNEAEQSLARRPSTESSFLVFSDDCLQLPFLCYRDNLIRGFVPNNNCQK